MTIRCKLSRGASAILLAASAAASAHAADATVTWTAPTNNTDGSPIPATGDSALASYLIEWGACSTAAGVTPQVLGTVRGNLSVNAPATSAVITGLTAATVYCLRMYATNVAAAKSAASGTVRYWVPAAAPGAPSNVTVVVVGSAP